jgi:6-phosphogluconolactonase (cycloisomerase 2 family)
MTRYAALAATAVLAGFGGSVAAQATLANVLAQPQSHSVFPHEGSRGWFAANANAKHPWLYVAGYNNSAIYVYDLAQIGNPQIGQITTGVNGPAGVTVDSHGTLYVVNQNANTVTIYPAGAISPSLTLTQGLSFPNSAAVNANGDVYVTSRNSVPASIVVYPQGQSKPSRYITGSLIQDPLQDFFDQAGNFYFADYSTGVNEIPIGSQQPKSLGLKEVPNPAGLALDRANGNLFVQNYATGSYKTLVYPPGDVNPLRTLNNGLAANFLAIGVIRNVKYVFVPNFFSNSVYVYRLKASKPQAVLNTSAENVNGVAFKPAGAP